MNISVPYMIDFPYNDDVQEFTIKYDSGKDKYDDLEIFLRAYPNHRINIELLNSDVDFVALQKLESIHSNIYYLLGEEYIEIYPEFQSRGLNYFFGLVVTNWDALHSSIAAKVSDVYIGGQIGFSLESVKALLEEAGIRSRAIVNFAQLENPFNTNDRIKSFFIRPEDLVIYSEFIDTFEFFYTAKSQIEVLYAVYLKEKMWFGNLNEIIANLDINIDNTTMFGDFAYFRLNCHKRCFQGSGCHICERMVDLSETLADKDYFFRAED